MEVGGAEMLAKDMAEAGAREFRFVFACLDDAGPLGEMLRKSGHVVEVFRRKPGIDLACARRLSQFFTQQRVDLVHAHLCGPFRYGALARLFSGRFPILLTDHGRGTNDVRSWRRIAINRLLLRRGDRIVGVGECLRNALVTKEGFPKERIEVIYNGRDLAKYTGGTGSRVEARRELGLSDEQFVVMQVARLSAEKDHATSVRAIAELAARYPQIRLVVVGDGSERAAVEQLVSQFGLQTHVRLIGERNDVERLLPAADAFILSSVTEAIPLTLIEAMGAGLPCVATRVGGVPEVVAENETGLLANVADAVGLAGCLERLMVDSDTRQRMGRAARLRAEKLFDREAMHAAYFARYRTMMNLAMESEPQLSLPIANAPVPATQSAEEEHP